MILSRYKINSLITLRKLWAPYWVSQSFSFTCLPLLLCTIWVSSQAFCPFLVPWNLKNHWELLLYYPQSLFAKKEDIRFDYSSVHLETVAQSISIKVEKVGIIYKLLRGLGYSRSSLLHWNQVYLRSIFFMGRFCLALISAKLALIFYPMEMPFTTWYNESDASDT